MSNKNFLHEKAFLTNKDTPLCTYIDKEKYPEQNKDKLGTIINISYRNATALVKRTPIPEEPYLKTDPAFILRWDNEFPYIRICINESGKIYVIKDINATKESDEINKVAVYPDQRYIFFLEEAKSTFNRYDIANIGKVITCYESEPNYAVICEIIEDQYIRFITSDESFYILDNYDPDKDKSEYKYESDVFRYIEDLLEEYEIYGSDN